MKKRLKTFSNSEKHQKLKDPNDPFDEKTRPKNNNTVSRPSKKLKKAKVPKPNEVQERPRPVSLKKRK